MQNFERLKNREDSSDFEDSWAVLLAPAPAIISQMFASLKKNIRASTHLVVAATEGGRRVSILRGSSGS